MTHKKIFLVFVILSFVILTINFAPELIQHQGDVSFRPIIFFHETSDRGDLNPRQACAVEAAARVHPDWDIQVMFLASELKFSGSLKTLQAIDNIKFAEINLKEYARRTPLEKLVTSGTLNNSRWKLSHTSDVLRYITLYKWGGVYLDLDTVVVKSFNGLKKNWSARESVYNVAAGAMSLSDDELGRTVAKMTVEDLAANFNGTIWGNNGPGVITRVLKKICSVDKVTKMSSSNCKGFKVYGPELFYPIRWQDAKQYFKPGHLNSTKVYVYHVWNKHTSKYKIPRNSIYANLAKKYCPSVYRDHLEDFGIPRLRKPRDSTEHITGLRKL